MRRVRWHPWDYTCRAYEFLPAGALERGRGGGPCRAAAAGGPVSRSRSCPCFVKLSLCAASAELRGGRFQASVSLCAGAFRPSSPLSLVSAKILRTNLALTAENEYDPEDALVSRACPPGGGNKPGRRGLSPIRDPGPCRSRDGRCFPSSLSPGPGVRRPHREKP